MDLLNSTLVELRQIAKEKGVKNVSKLKKEELIHILEELEKPVEEKPKKFYPLVNDNQENYVEEPQLTAGNGYQLTSEDDRIVEGVLEILPDGYGFLRGENYLSTPSMFHLYKFVDSV